MNRHVLHHRFQQRTPGLAVIGGSIDSFEAPGLTDLARIVALVGSGLQPLFHRRQQTLLVGPATAPVLTRLDQRLTVALVSAIMVEAAGLSFARSTLRCDLDNDDGDAVLTLCGANDSHIPPDWMRLDPEISCIAAEAGAEVEMLWDADEGPTLVLRLPGPRS
jgi:hypothetical protein